MTQSASPVPPAAGSTPKRRFPFGWCGLVGIGCLLAAFCLICAIVLGFCSLTGTLFGAIGSPTTPVPGVTLTATITPGPSPTPTVTPTPTGICLKLNGQKITKGTKVWSFEKGQFTQMSYPTFIFSGEETVTEKELGGYCASSWTTPLLGPLWVSISNLPQAGSTPVPAATRTKTKTP